MGGLLGRPKGMLAPPLKLLGGLAPLAPLFLRLCVLRDTKPCINKTFLSLLMTCFMLLHMQALGKYSINTEANARLQNFARIYERLVNSDIVKMQKWTRLNEKFTESDFYL